VKGRSASTTIARLRAHAVGRGFFQSPDLQHALDTFGFVQADPIRAPARAQDLTLRHRVADYCAGDLENRFEALSIEEDFFINYGFMTPAVHALLHPRARKKWPRVRQARADAILAFIRDRGLAHPREVEQEFQHGRVTNYWGGSSNATTHLLELMHFRGLLRVVKRDAGIRVYGVREPAPDVEGHDPDAKLDAMVDVIVRMYAPLPAPSFSPLVMRLRWGVPQWSDRVPKALARAKHRLAHASADGTEWYWPSDETPGTFAPDDRVRLLAPFDPVVWDRRRFELLWGWAYRFEAYTPVAKRRLGYYALPLLWRDQVVGWANAAIKEGALVLEPGYVAGRAPGSRAFRREFEAEVERFKRFLRLRHESLTGVASGL